MTGRAGPLLVCSPLRLEARAVRRGMPGPANASVRVTGYGPARSRRQARALANADFGALAIAGVGGGLTDDLSPGDLVVGTEVSDGQHTTRCAAAPLLAGELRRAGLPATAGPVVTVDRLALSAAARQQLAAGGALVADMESAPLAAAAGDRPVAVLRAVSDTPARPLLRPGIVTGGLAALRSLRAASPVLAQWAAVAGPACPPPPGRWSPWTAWPWVPPRGAGWRPAARWSLTWSPRRWPRPRGTGRSRCSVRCRTPRHGRCCTRGS